MSSDLMLDFINHQQYPGMDSEAAITSIDQGGEEWGKRVPSRKIQTFKMLQLQHRSLAPKLS